MEPCRTRVCQRAQTAHRPISECAWHCWQHDTSQEEDPPHWPTFEDVTGFIRHRTIWPETPAMPDTRPECDSIARSPFSRQAGQEVRIAQALLKEAQLKAVRQSDAEVFVNGRSPQPGSVGRLRDLTYDMVRNSSFAVLPV
jgi:hypothetical protein